MNTIIIDEELILRAYDGEVEFALEWYQDMESLVLVDGKNASQYDISRLKTMYEYLNSYGELYFICIKDDSSYIPVGDVTFSKDDIPIFISKSFQNMGVGSRVVSALIERGRQLKFESITIREIYDFNIPSQKLFTSLGFKKYKETKDGYSYILYL